jgi:hypothetical protein
VWHDWDTVLLYSYYGLVLHHGVLELVRWKKKFDTLQNHLPRDQFGRAHKTSTDLER